MTLCIDERRIGKAAIRYDETYWSSANAAQPVLLIEEATQAITEALHRVRGGPMLDERDLAAAGVALRDLVGGLEELADLLTIPAQDRLPKHRRLQQPNSQFSAVAG
jgi:hypothetical protein